MLCSWCNGSGEGFGPDSTCQNCKGFGEEPTLVEEIEEDPNDRTADLQEIF